MSIPIRYTVARDFNYLSRYRMLRQIIIGEGTSNPVVVFEYPNKFTTSSTLQYHEVLPEEADRLDLLAYRLLGSVDYSWILAFINNIQDSYTVSNGFNLAYPSSVSDLLKSGEFFAPVSPISMNLGTE